jgi:hypothetical protein
VVDLRSYMRSKWSRSGTAFRTGDTRCRSGWTSDWLSVHSWPMVADGRGLDVGGDDLASPRLWMPPVVTPPRCRGPKRETVGPFDLYCDSRLSCFEVIRDVCSRGLVLIEHFI